MSQSLPPGLYIVATPIGNLGDLTARGADTLRRVDSILAEDKRVTAKLLAHIGATAPMTAYHDHSDDKLRDHIVAELGSKAVALVSDAGTPLISDPGYKLVQSALRAGHEVHTVPGPSAVIAAMERMGFRVLHLYGLTESYGPATWCPPQAGWPAEERAARMARQGVRYPTLPGMQVADPGTLQPVPADGATLATAG